MSKIEKKKTNRRFLTEAKTASCNVWPEMQKYSMQKYIKKRETANPLALVRLAPENKRKKSEMIKELLKRLLAKLTYK